MEGTSRSPSPGDRTAGASRRAPFPRAAPRPCGRRTRGSACGEGSRSCTARGGAQAQFSCNGPAAEERWAGLLRSRDRTCPSRLPTPVSSRADLRSWLSSDSDPPCMKWTSLKPRLSTAAAEQWTCDSSTWQVRGGRGLCAGVETHQARVRAPSPDQPVATSDPLGRPQRAGSPERPDVARSRSISRTSSLDASAKHGSGAGPLRGTAAAEGGWDSTATSVLVARRLERATGLECDHSGAMSRTRSHGPDRTPVDSATSRAARRGTIVGPVWQPGGRRTRGRTCRRRT